MGATDQDQKMQPLAAEQGQLATGTDEAPSAANDPRLRRDFFVMSNAVGLNHAMVTTPIIFASSVLIEFNGQMANALLYATTFIVTSFFALPMLSIFGAKKGLGIAMALYAANVFCFGLASSGCAKRDDKGKCQEAESSQLLMVVIGALIGGVGAGLLWTCQFTYFNKIAKMVAEAEGKSMPEITTQLGGTFGFLFLAWEAVARAGFTLLSNSDYVGLSFTVIFFIYSGLAVVATLGFLALAVDWTKDQAAESNFCGKLSAAVGLWGDPKIWLLQCTTVTFNFAAAWLAGYVGRNILSKALNASFIGFAGGILSALASILSLFMGQIGKTLGKPMVLGFGALSFFVLGALSKFVGDPTAWGWGTLIFYALMGIGRAVYESINKAIVADFYPPDKGGPAAGANVMMFGTLSGTIAYILGAFKQDTPELVALLLFGVLTLPCYGAAVKLKQREGDSARQVTG